MGTGYFTKGATLATGGQVAATTLHQLVEDATLNPAHFTGLTAKTTTVSGDLLMLSDSESSYALKKVTLANVLPASSVRASKIYTAEEFVFLQVRVQYSTAHGWVWMNGGSNNLILQETTSSGAALGTPLIPIQVNEGTASNTLFLNSTGIGVLNSSPAHALDVTGAIRTSSKLVVRAAAPMIALTDTTDPYYAGFFMDAGYLFFGKLASEGGASATGYTPFACAVNAVDNLLRIETGGVTMAGTLGVTGAATLSGALYLAEGTAPASASATGTKGEIRWSASTGYLYVCTATNTWKRAALTTW